MKPLWPLVFSFSGPATKGHVIGGKAAKKLLALFCQTMNAKSYERKKCYRI
jgi:hypothetical protein